MLQIHIQEKKYNELILFQNVDIQIQSAGLYGLVGKNGTGKTTFFNCLAHLTPFGGEILYKNKKIQPSQVGFIPTEPFLYEYLTVGEFYTFAKLLLNSKKTPNYLFDIEKNALIRELSTGIRKKVSINATLQKTYDVYIFDEPYSGLDMQSVYDLQKIIKELAQKHIVFISSHILEFLEDCQAIFIIKEKNIFKISPKTPKNNLKNIIFE